MTDQPFIPILDLSAQISSLRNEFISAFEGVLDSGRFIMGPDVRGLEEELEGYFPARHAIGVNSGTDALVIGLRAAGVQPGDEVITTPFSFFATAESISAIGAVPVFVDIEAETFNIDPTAIEAAISAKTKAILPVHLYGRPANMTAIMAIAAEHGLRVIEDCAQSFGADNASQKAGTIGDVGAFSFFPSKNLGGFGDGGLMITNDDAVAAEARRLRVHGAQKKYHNEVIGYNSRLDSVQAAMLRIKLKHIDTWNKGRRAVAERYGQLLADIDGVTAPELVDGHVFHQYTVRILSKDRDQVQAALADAGIGTMIYYPIPQDRLPVYAGLGGNCPVSDQAAKEVLSLPIWPELDSAKQERIAEALASVLGH